MHTARRLAVLFVVATSAATVFSVSDSRAQSAVDATQSEFALQRDSNKAYAKSQQAATPAERAALLKQALVAAEALAKLKPDDPNYRFNVGFLLHESGDFAQAKKIMDELSPRNATGFAKAHLWQANQLLAPDRPLSAENLDVAEAHLMRALATHPEPEEIHLRLGELFYFRYVRYNPRVIDPRIPAREVYLAKADEHLSKVKMLNPKLKLTLAEIRALQNRTVEAEADVRQVVGELNGRLRQVPDDVESRIRLAQAYRMISEFENAAVVLQAGISLRPDERFQQELSGVYYFESLHLRQRVPDSLPAQFMAMRKAYLAYPTNNYVTFRFVQALSSADNEEVEIARSTLLKLIEGQAPGQAAPFLIGFDYVRRNDQDGADKYFKIVREAKADATPEVIAGLITAVLNGQVKSVDPMAAHRLFETALKVWPEHPDLLMVRAQQNMMLKSFPQALGDLQKALEQRPHDAKLHEMLAATYHALGQVDNAEKHRAAAEAARTGTPIAPP